MKKTVKIIKYSQLDYDKALKIQEDLRRDITIKEEDNTILLLEHPPTITYGLRVNEKNLFISADECKKRNINVVETTRGGDITFHGPGQLVIYPIINIKDFNFSIVAYVEMLENTIISVLKSHFINARKIPKLRGVFVDDKKIASIGINVKKYITIHGAALNINTDLDYFKLINPCGLEMQTTSAEQELGKPLVMSDIMDEWIKAFQSHTNCELEITNGDSND